MMAMFSFVPVLLLVALGEVVRGEEERIGRLVDSIIFLQQEIRHKRDIREGESRVKEWKSEGERSSCHSLVFTQNAGVTTGSK